MWRSKCTKLAKRFYVNFRLGYWYSIALTEIYDKKIDYYLFSINKFVILKRRTRRKARELGGKDRQYKQTDKKETRKWKEHEFIP